MASRALITWHTDCAARLDELLALHRKATGGSRGRRWDTTQFNRNMLAALVAQFQSFCRDLHDCAVAEHVAAAIESQRPMLRVLLTEGRQLDTKNPRGGALGADFGRLGFGLVPAIKTADSDASALLADLEALIDFRNAVSHGNESKIKTITAVRATKRDFVKYWKMIDHLASTMDRVVADQLQALLGGPRPW